MTEITYAKKVKDFKLWEFVGKFFIIPRSPSIIEKELLVNVLNGIYIDTMNEAEGDIEDRYFVFGDKNI